jgi:hypothetical protein
MRGAVYGLVAASLVAVAWLSQAALAHMDLAGTTRQAAHTPWAPTAYGAVLHDGSVASGSGNFTVAWDRRHGWYAITIAGVSYNFTANTTVLGRVTQGAQCRADSLAGDLLVRCQDAAGRPVQASFAFNSF